MLLVRALFLLAMVALAVGHRRRPNVLSPPHLAGAQSSELYPPPGWGRGLDFNRCDGQLHLLENKTQELNIDLWRKLLDPYCKNKTIELEDQKVGKFYRLRPPMNHTCMLPENAIEIGIRFLAYTSANRNQAKEITIADQQTYYFGLDTSKRIVVLVHGFLMNSTYPALLKLKNSLLEYSNGEVGTVILVDWARGAKSHLVSGDPDNVPWWTAVPQCKTLMLGYAQASANTQLVGRYITYLLNQLQKLLSVKVSNFYCLGFSLGAQICGFAGKYSQSEYKWNFGRITGLDAAKPLFEGYPKAHLSKKDADFVDGIHTSARSHVSALFPLGFLTDYAHVDIYPANFSNQPMCTSWLSNELCNHKASLLYYEASLSGKSKCEMKGYEVSVSKWDTVVGYQAEKYPGRGHRLAQPTKEMPYCKP